MSTYLPVQTGSGLLWFLSILDWAAEREQSWVAAVPWHCPLRSLGNVRVCGYRVRPFGGCIFLILSPHLDPKPLIFKLCINGISSVCCYDIQILGFSWSLWELCKVNNGAGKENYSCHLLVVYKATDRTSVWLKNENKYNGMGQVIKWHKGLSRLQYSLQKTIPYIYTYSTKWL